MHRLATKEDFQKLVKYLREYITDYYKDDDDEDKIIDFSSFTSKILQFRSDAYYDKKFNRIINVFEFVDEFKVEISEEELDALILILFNEVDLMNQDTEVEIKKEKNIWHFNPELAVYSPDGKLMELYTILNHFKDECFKENNKSTNYKKTILSKCAYTLVGIIPTCVYKFDNGLEIELSENNIDNLISILTDEY